MRSASTETHTCSHAYARARARKQAGKLKKDCKWTKEQVAKHSQKKCLLKIYFLEIKVDDEEYYTQDENTDSNTSNIKQIT